MKAKTRRVLTKAGKLFFLSLIVIILVSIFLIIKFRPKEKLKVDVVNTFKVDVNDYYQKFILKKYGLFGFDSIIIKAEDLNKKGYELAYMKKECLDKSFATIKTLAFDEKYMIEINLNCDK